MSKKVMLIDARVGSDFTIDAVWAGLVARHGWENIIDWPPADKHREGVPVVTGDIDKDYGAERRSLCYTADHKKFHRHTVEEIDGMLRNGQIERIFVDERMESFEWYVKTKARFYDVPVVVIAGHDRFWNESPQKVAQIYGKKFEAIFLDNWRREYGQIQNAHLMNYATNFDHLWDWHNREEFLNKKVYDICFMGYNSHGDRAVIVDHLLKKYGTEGNCLFIEKRANTIECFLPKREYFKKMAQSRICINLKGAAECGKALRFYEIPYVGSYMLSQKFSGVQMHPFHDGFDCGYFETIDELDAKIKWALDHPTEREKIAYEGHQNAMKFHTAEARVDYIYRMLEMSPNR